MMTSLSVGSLLDDNIWHEVIIMRNRLNVIFSVDRVTIEGRIKGEFERLDLNHEVLKLINEIYAYKIANKANILIDLYRWRTPFE